MHRHIAIICNPKSGKGKPLSLLPLFEQFLTKKDIQFTSFTAQLPDSLHHFSDLVIMGGDGTLNYVINHVNNIDIPIGYISCGTGNDIGKLFFGKATHQQQFEMAISSIPKKTDAGICNGKLFLNGAGIGFDGWVVKRLMAKSLFTGIAAYYTTVIGLLLFYRESEVEIIVDDKRFNTKLFMLNAANGVSYGGGFKVAPKALINDGLLDINIISEISLLKRLMYLPVIEKGKHLDKGLPFVDYKTARKINIKSHHELQAHLDGEYFSANEFEIEVLPGKYQFRY